MNDRSTSTSELIGELSERLTALIRQELRLARLELTRKGRSAGFGAGLLGAAGMTAFLGAATLVAAVVLALALVLPGWAAAAVVGAVLLVAAAVLGLAGRAKVAEAAPPVPEETLAGVKADLDEVKGRARR